MNDYKAIKENIEALENKEEFQSNIWGKSIFNITVSDKNVFDLTENDELVLKIIYHLENVFVEHLKLILKPIFTDYGFRRMTKRLEDEKWIWSKNLNLGRVYALNEKAVKLIKPHDAIQKKINISEASVYLNYVKGAIIANKIESLAFQKVSNSFKKESAQFKELYIYYQYIKNIVYKGFLKKSDEEKINELKYVGYSKEEIEQFINGSKLKKLNANEIKKFQKKYKNKYNEVSKTKMYKAFHKRFIGADPVEGMYFFKDYRSNLFAKTNNIDLLKFFMKSKNNYLKHSNKKVRNEVLALLTSTSKIAKPFTYSKDSDVILFNGESLKSYLELEEELSFYRKRLERVMGFERRYAKDIVELKKRENDEALLDNKNKKYRAVEKYLNEINDKIAKLEEYVSINLNDKEDDQALVRPMTFDILKDNGIFSDNLRKVGNQAIVELGIVDNLKYGLETSVLFKRIFMAKQFFLLLGEDVKINYKIYTFTKSRYDYIESRIPLLEDKFKGFTSKEFGQEIDNLEIVNLEREKVLEHWQFYNKIKKEIEEIAK
ncbi:hypothetical protein [Brassicibacter mesophilus]|uniref:hypothetical protein n=1 Tax=Brassicibacter mesophilus TaxID=745119 RepID=UPI003D1BF62E